MKMIITIRPVGREGGGINCGRGPRICISNLSCQDQDDVRMPNPEGQGKSSVKSVFLVFWDVWLERPQPVENQFKKTDIYQLLC